MAKLNTLVWSEPYQDIDSGDFVSTVSYAFKNTQGQLGVLTADVSFKSVSDLIKALNTSDGAQASMIAKSGIVVASSKKALINKNYPYNDVFKAVLNANKQSASLTLKQKEFAAIYFDQGTSTHPLVVLATMDKATMQKTLWFQVLVTVILILVMLAMICLNAAIITRFISSITNLETVANSITNVQSIVLENLENISASTEENAAGTQEVSANAEEVLATTEEFTQHVSDLRQIASQLERSASKFTLS